MGGVRPPSAKFRLVQETKIPRIVEAKIVEKVVEVERLVSDPALQAEIASLRIRLASEGAKVATLEQRMAQAPDGPRVVEKIMWRDKPVPVEVEKRVEVVVTKEIKTPWHKDRAVWMALVWATAAGLGLGAML